MNGVVSSLARLARVDGTRMARDPMLRPFLVGPPLLVLVARFAVPAVEVAAGERGVDLVAHRPFTVALLILLVLPFLFGALVGLLALEERDAGMLPALRCTPLGLGGYLTWRLGGGAAVTAVALAVGLPTSGLVEASPLRLVPVVVLGALLAVLCGLLLPAFAANVVEGLAAFKIAGALLFVPLAAWFPQVRWSGLTAVVPSYWVAQAYWAAESGRSVWPPTVVGLGAITVLGALVSVRLRAGLNRT